MADFTQRDTGSTLAITLQDQSGVAIDLTGASVALQYYIDTNPPLFTRAMTITNAKAGQCSYQFTVNSGVYDLDPAGTMHFTVVITFGNGQIVSSPFEGQITIWPSWPLQVTSG
jgi:hypothetical protein